MRVHASHKQPSTDRGSHPRPPGGTHDGPHQANPVAQGSAVHDVLRISGQSLARELAEETEARFGTDFSHVRVHSDGAAHASVARIGAYAVRPVEGERTDGVREVLRSPGQRLDPQARTEMEQRFDADFSGVRIHADAAAKASASRIGARAYTSGNHIVLGEGGGRHTLAHELTHVLQQRQGPVAGTDNGSGLRVSDPSDRFEREAEDNATRVMRGPAHATAPSAEVAPHTPRPGAVEPFVQRLAIPTARPTQPNYNPTLDTRGRAEESEILTDGSLIGTAPSVDPPGYDYIRSLGLTSWWIRFHLVSQHAGGPGNTAGNLVPTSQSHNQRYEKSVESDLKDDVENARNNPQCGEWVYFGVHVNYNTQPSANASPAEVAAAPNFPSSLDIWHRKYTPTSGWQNMNKHQNSPFNLLNNLPRDTRKPKLLSGIDLAELKAYTGLPPGSTVWNQEDVNFLHSISTGNSRNAEFMGHVNASTGTRGEQFFRAFELIPFSQPQPSARAGLRPPTEPPTTFAIRMGEKGGDALERLAFTMGIGVLTP